MADDPHEARRILLDFITAIDKHAVWCQPALDDPTAYAFTTCTHFSDRQKARQALDSLELQHLDELAPR